jgi:hypothetical protein
MVQWIAEHPDLGATAGLEALGFYTSSDSTVMAGLMCLYDFLDQHLTLHDEQVFRFGPIFVKHILCKVIRWIGRLGSLLDLKSMGRDFEQSIIWESGANLTDAHCFPIPLQVSLQHLKETLKTLPVSLCILILMDFNKLSIISGFLEVLMTTQKQLCASAGLLTAFGL